MALYFIQPTGHSLREIDIEFLRRISPRVNVIPVIAKGDSLTRDEVVEFKKKVMFDNRLWPKSLCLKFLFMISQ